MKQDDLKRFWTRVQKGGDDECWVWVGGSCCKGYGYFYYRGRRIPAHVFSYYVVNKRWPDRQVLHECPQRRCVNPRHLREAGSVGLMPKPEDMTILAMAARGMNNQQISAMVGYSVATINRSMNRIYTALGLSNVDGSVRVQAVLWYREYQERETATVTGVISAD